MNSQTDFPLLDSSVIETPLPEIEWRVNPRAKRLRLTLKADRVWVTIPPRTSQATTDRFLRETNAWLKEQWHKLQQRKLQQLQRDAELALNPHLAVKPVSDTQLHLPVYQAIWQIDVSCDYARVKEYEYTLCIPEINKNEHLRKWVKNKAQSYLPIRLAELAAEHQFKYSGCTVRHARTRWGSCSRLGKINLNASLILLPPELLDYVLLHELCHTREFNHSPYFWAEMYAVDPAFKSHRQALKHFVLPSWWNE
ncbi:MAG: M48 family metallopeptidase [Gammaproteobacteria bacterium]|nr:M48 family metallopeptidase [Gammaproteobacteria bacterium]